MAQKEMSPREQKRRDEMVAVLSHPLIGAYIGPNSEGYLSMWREQLETRNYFKQPIGFAILLMLIWPLWFAYRKMFFRLAVFFSFAAFISLIGSFAPLFIGTSIVLGLYGKHAYYQRVSSFFKKNGHLPEEKLLRLIQDEGDISATVPIFIVIIYAAFLGFLVFNELLMHQCRTTGFCL